MPAPIFLDIAALFKTRLQGISVANGFNHDLGAGVYVDGLQPVPMDTSGNLPAPGVVMIDPAEPAVNDTPGELRASTAQLQARFERVVGVIVVQPITDKTTWLQVYEEVGQDLRAALFADQADWRQRKVVRIYQSAQEASWPEAGSGALIIKCDFTITYIED